MRMWIHVLTYTHTEAFHVMNMHVYRHIYKHTCIHNLSRSSTVTTNTFILAYMHTCTYPYINICAAHIDLYTYIHTCTYTLSSHRPSLRCIHAYIHTYISYTYMHIYPAKVTDHDRSVNAYIHTYIRLIHIHELHTSHTHTCMHTLQRPPTITAKSMHTYTHTSHTNTCIHTMSSHRPWSLS